MEENAIQVYEVPPLSAPQIREQVNLIQSIMKDVMQEGQHYGVIPGCGDKPSLLKPGAEKLMFTFRLVADPEVEVFELFHPTVAGHREYRVKVRISSMHGVYMGGGVGSCSTMEGKYRFRKADLLCPDCGKPAIIKGKEEFGGGWICYAKKGGCGKKWTDKDNPFQGVNTDRAEHDNPADYYNTCEKMAKKRALVDATLTVTAASDIFTQDIEEMVEVIPAAKVAAEKKESGKEPIKEPAKKTEGKNPSEPATEAQIKALHAILGKIPIKDELEKCKAVSQAIGMREGETITSLEKLTKAQASTAIKSLMGEK
jgi:hypothetical protein